MKKHSISKTIALSLGVLAMSLLISFIVLAWTEPGSSPPGGNVAAPLWSESADLNLAGSTWTERSITNINVLSGYNDLFLKGNLAETAPVYMAGSELTFYTGGTERMKVDSSGLEITKEIALFDVEEGLILKNSDTGGYMSPAMYFKQSLNANYIGRLFTYYGYSYQFQGTSDGGDNWYDVARMSTDTSYIQAGNFGIGTMEPTQKLTIVNGNLELEATSPTFDDDATLSLGGTRVSPTAGNIVFGDGSGWKLHIAKKSDDAATKFVTFQDNGNVGIGTTDPGDYRLNVSGGWVRIGDGGGGTINLESQGDFHRIAFYDLRFWDWDTGGDMVTLNNGTMTIGGGTGKLTVGTIDPIFEIEGEKYATYVADFAGGVRMETSGILKLENGKQIIDFESLEKGNDLWLFWQTSNKKINDVAVLLTPGFEGRVWYEKQGNVLVIYGDKQGEVSYRLSAPRVDSEKWLNLIEDQSVSGIKISD